jgi:hypothetical protein
MVGELLNVESFFGWQVMVRTQVFEWFLKFKFDVRYGQGGEHFGCPFTSTTNKNVDQLMEHVIKNVRPTIYKVTNMLGISFDSVRAL